MHDWNELQIFATVARRRSFTSAGTELRLPKSTLSRAVARLEARLGVRLLERSTRQVSLTEYGERYVAFCDRMVQEASEAGQLLEQMQGEPTGTLRIGAPITFSRSFLADALPRFLRRYPQVNVVLKVGAPLDPLRDRLDMVIHAGYGSGNSDLVRRQIGRLPTVLVASAAYVKQQGRPKTIDALARHACLGQSEREEWTLRNGRAEKKQKCSGQIAAGDPVLLQQMVLAGFGIGLLPLWLVEDDLRRSKLERLLPEWAGPEVELTALYASRSGLLPKTRVFLEFLTTDFAPALAHLK
jgi:DNA-binding transcriptional LysR family regulator